VIIAITLGPWAAVIAVTVALLFQALLFGDGGVLAYGANVVNMAIILPFVGYGVYRLIAGRVALTAGRRITAAAVGGYCGINAAAFAAAIEFGIQPGLFHTASGAPLYSPYHLAQTIPAMMLAHLTVAGAAEAILTGGVLAYLVRADPRRLVANHPGIPVGGAAAPAPASAPAAKRRALTPARVAVGFIAVMVLLTPLGLLAPGGAFGEDAPANLDLDGLGLTTVPTGLARYNGFWSHALLGGYGFKDGQHTRLGYALSAIVGIAIIAIMIFTVGKVIDIVMRRRRGADADVDVREPSKI
jgi:cobalt/nickel transport system permease protein